MALCSQFKSVGFCERLDEIGARPSIGTVAVSGNLATLCINLAVRRVGTVDGSE